MADASQLLGEALAKLDAATSLEHHGVTTALEPIGKVAKAAGQTIDELRFEFVAVYLALYDEPNVWGTYFGPEMSSIAEDGQRFDTPPLESITPQCIAYWTTRMNAARHPALRARYADMVWDLSQKATGNKPPIDAARIAIDGYAEALTTYPEMSSHSWGDIRKRIIDLALSINDEERLRKAVAANVAFANAKVDKEESEFRHRSLFAILRSIPPKRRPQAEFQAEIDDFRSRVEKLDAEEADQFSMDRYALPLADFYWSSQQQEEAKKVMRMYGAAVERMATKTTMATLGVGWLKQLYEHYLRFEMNDEAKHVLKRIEELQPGVPKDLVPISTSQHITKEEIDEWLDWLVTDDAEESFANLTGHFFPKLDDLKRQIDGIKRDFPLSQMFTSTYVDHEGRAVAEIAPDDIEGKLVRQSVQDIEFRNTFLDLGLRRLLEKHAVGVDELFARVTESPVWHESRHPILRRGIEAFYAGDAIAAVHILVPEIECAIRIIAYSLKLNLQKPNRMGGFDLKNLSDFLADERVAAFLTEDVVTYLRVVLTDRRGLNLRNNTCHGIMRAAGFTPAASQRLLHIVLLLSAVRTKDDAASTEVEPHEPSSSADVSPEGGE